MWSLRLQKITSFILIFFLMFSMTLRIPFELFFGQSAYATDDEIYDLVSIIVDEQTYEQVRSKLVRYSRDIQGKLENTRVVVIPTPSDASVVDIASLNESLYFEGYKAHKNVNFESRLVGTVLVGKIPVPVVFEGSNSARSLTPYIDFEDKAFIFQHDSKRYESNDSAENDFMPEIWHGVVSPNTGSTSSDITAIEGYLDKNHDFYTGAGVFDEELGVIDGQNTPTQTDYEPYVFYYDQFRENSAIQYQKYMGYEMYLQSIEDITYNRYSKELAERIKNQILGVQNLEVADLIKNVDPNFDISGLSDGPNVNSSPDIVTRYITDNSTKRFLEIFNSSTLGDMRKHVYNAGRYNEGGSKVNVDMPPFLISVLDEVSTEVIKNVNTALEDDIVDLVTGGLARDIAIPVTEDRYSTTKASGTIPSGIPFTQSTVSSTGATLIVQVDDQICPLENHTFYYGTPSLDITNASECSIYRGSTSSSGTLVESNRGYNINNTEADSNLCGLGMKYDEIAGEITQGLTGYWGGNSPVNLSGQGSNYSDFQLGDHNLKGGIRPVFDVLGMKEIDDSSKIASPLDCFSQNTNIQTLRHEVYTQRQGPEDETSVCGVKFSLPVREGDSLQYFSSVPNGQPSGTTHESRFCAAQNIIKATLPEFQSVYLTGLQVERCSSKTASLDGAVVVSAVDPNIDATFGPDQEPVCPIKTYKSSDYKKISSHILHSSPTDEEFGSQVKSLFTPSLPIDSDRYIDFIGANGQGTDKGYKRIDLPQIFRVIADEGEDVELETIAEKVKEHLDEVSDQINGVIRSANPAGLTGRNLELYNLLKVGPYPNADIDLYQSLISKPLEVFTSDNQSKEISYFDTLVFAVYWNNLDTVSSKYKFIFDEYLGNQFTGSDNAFHLPNSKKSYEMAYFGAPGDAQNMYVKLDPEGKALHPYAEILAKNIGLQSTLQAANIQGPNSNDSEGTFACAPPDGVPIWEWIPAVTCWLGNMLPPTIAVGAGSCGHSDIFLSSEEQAFVEACKGDINKNGVNDCLESKLEAGNMTLISDSGKYFYNTSGVLTSQVYDEQGQKVFFDNTSYVDFELARVDIPDDPLQVFDDNNTRSIYDTQSEELAGEDDLKEAQKYVSFSNSRTRSQRGEANAYFSVKSKDANLYFRSRITTANSSGQDIIDIESSLRKIEVRSDRTFIQSFVVDEDATGGPNNTLVASSQQNIFLSDGSINSFENISSSLLTESSAKQKLWLSVSNYSQDGNTLDLNYPLSLELERDGELVFSQSDVSKSDITGIYPLFSASISGQYTLRVQDSTGLNAYKNIDVLPELAENLVPTLGASLVETGGNVSTHLFTITDEYGNPATGDIYTVDIEIEGEGLTFQKTGTKELSYELVDGFKAFRLLSTDSPDVNTLTFTLKDAGGNTIEVVRREITTIETINVEISPPSAIPEVGGGNYSYDLRFVDSGGNLLSGLNSRVYLGMNRLYGKPDSAYNEIVGGKSEIGFTTGDLAGQDVVIEFQFEGGNDIYKKTIDILPGDPIKVDLNLSRDKIEASPDGKSILEAILKDRYNNDVFNDNSTILNLEIPEQSQDIITSGNLQKTVSNGKAQFELNGTDIPGRAYFKISSDPDISTNNFDIIGQRAFDTSELSVPTMKTASGGLSENGKKFFGDNGSGQIRSLFSSKQALLGNDDFRELANVLQNQLESFWDRMNSTNIVGLGENAGSIETFFFWDKDDIDGSAYNSVYSILSGAPYGDISQENYLGGALLFDPDNSSLVVSSLLESPYKFHDVVTLGAKGGLQQMRSGDITQDIEFILDIDDEGRIMVDMFNGALETYLGRLYYNLSSESEMSLTFDNSQGYTTRDRGGDVLIQNSSGKVLFELLSNGRFVRKAGVTLNYDRTHRGAGLKMQIYSGDTQIGDILVEGNLETNVTRDVRLLESKLQTLDNTIIIHLNSNEYDTRRVFSDEQSSLLKIYYKDPFSQKYELSDFYNTGVAGLENIREEEGIGWQDSNTMLLEFASGESVGNATKDFQSISFINLGDPVVSLKKLDTFFPGTSQKKSFDSTFGSSLVQEEGLEDYRIFDYNNDEKLDVLLIMNDGYMKLLERQDLDSSFIEHNDLVFAIDRGSSRLIKTGDFSGDGYSDIFFVTESGKPAMYHNVEKNFIRLDLQDQIDVNGSIVQVESYDMDNDSIHDLVVLDESGEIHIFYGAASSGAPVFTKNRVGSSYGINLSDEVLAHGGAVYFDGLKQVDVTDVSALRQDSAAYLAELQASQESGSDAPNPDFIDSALVDQFLYIQLPHDTGDDLSNISSDTRRYLRSEYAGLEGLEIQKTYTDVNEGYIIAGDTVHLDISITNNSQETISDITYVDNVSKYFRFSKESFTMLGVGEVNLRNKALGNYNIVVDSFELAPGEQKLLRFDIQSLPLSYGDMQVGLYESGEVGDDPYGDIILKEDTKNCGSVADIYRSTGQRSYEEGETSPSCDSGDIDIGNTHPNLVDANDDGIPDYLEAIIENDDPEEIKDYAENALSELFEDTDNDGIPDSDDSMDRTDSATDFMGALGQIDEAAGEISEEIDTLIEGMGCGFGGGSCIATPLNWAPLAPGNDPTLFGRPQGDGLKVGEGQPIFSALTGNQTVCGNSPCCLPSVYPAKSQGFVPGPACGPDSAGGSKGTWAPTNFVRIFVTPTLTGGIGTAVCFGGPASVAGNSNPQGAHPIVPGGNCIVTAKPIASCDGGEGDPGVLGYPYPASSTSTNSFSVIHANCDGAGGNAYTPASIEEAFVKDYLEYQKTGIEPAGLYDKFVRAFQEVADNGTGNYQGGGEPLVSIGQGEPGLMSTQVSLDTSALAGGNFEDVVQIENKRIAGFPGFIMDWVEAQLDEVTSKLTNLPKVFVILPDFGGVMDEGFEDYISGASEAFEKGAQEDQQERDKFDQERQALESERASLDCEGDDSFRCRTIDVRLSGLGASQTGKEYASGIKEVYEFLGNIPFVNIETEKVAVNIPWIETSELYKFILQWEETYEQWENEIQDFTASIPTPDSCNTYVGEDLVRCEAQIQLSAQALVDAQKLLSSLEANIGILKEYQEFPEKISKLISKKEDWLEQVLCNIDAISEFIGGWISSNGERFKAWVELYILIKAILKSWQVFIDIFNSYEDECHECKNERQDLQNFTFGLVGSILPSAPIIQFPKWPDIILDLHNVRVGMTVTMPELDIQMRPIVLPALPTLTLPRPDLSASVSGNFGVSLDLPELPLLPEFSVPELPDLPSLPTVELPDLPPPPKIPKLFGAVEGMLNIVKLITKVMCILKNSPFVPEWRAGDQIAFLTERNGHISTDFLNMQAPAFSYSAVSAIEVKTFVNFEFEMDFIVEAVKSITAPLDSMSSNIVNMFDISLGDIEVVNPIPTNVDISIEGSEEISLAPLTENPEGIAFIASLIVQKSQELLVYLNENSSVTLDNNEFKSYVGSELATTNITENQRTSELQNIWNKVFEFNDTSSDRFIGELEENNRAKFEALGNILRTEMEYSKQQQRELENIGAPSFITQTSLNQDTVSSRVEGYNDSLDEFNAKAMESTLTLLRGESDETRAFREDIESAGDDLMNQVRGGLQSYQENTLLAAVAPSSSTTVSGGSCQASGAYNYRYEGLYVMEDDRNYKLFDYTDILRGNEKPTIVDLDNDGDDDVLYQIGDKIYFKENTKAAAATEHVPGPPLILAVGDNKMFNGDQYHEALNGFTEVGVSDGSINIEFERPTNTSISQYSLNYHTIVDRYIDTRIDYTPRSVETHIVDAIAIDSASQLGDNFTLTQHPATLIYAGAMRDITLQTPKLRNIASDLIDNTEVTLTANKDLYAGSSSYTMSYIPNGGEGEVLRVPAYQSVSFDSPVTITELRGEAYVSLGETEDIDDTDILDFIGKPILPGSKIIYEGNTAVLDESSHIDIRYSDGTLRQIDFRDISSFELYDLGRAYGDSYKIRLDVENDFYYGRMQSFKDGVYSTWSRQTLLAPQSESDVIAPQIGLGQSIRVPVYQSYDFDLTPYIYEDGGLTGISDIRIDLDLEVDSDGDGDSRNDDDTENISVNLSPVQIGITFGPYDELFTKQISLAIEDDNGNVARRNVSLEVYTPKPSIDAVEDNTITGKINETLTDEPVRLYRYRGGVVEKLQTVDGTDIIVTDDTGNYSFESSRTSSGLVLEQAGSPILSIDEYTGRIDTQGALTSVSVLPSNAQDNTSLYPEIKVLYAGNPVFRQFVKMPEGEVDQVSSFADITDTGLSLKVLDQERYNSFRVPLGASYNPGSVSVYITSDTGKTPVMTVFRDGRINIDQSRYTLEYRSVGEKFSLILIQKGTNTEIAEVLYTMDASYILR